MTIEAPIKGVSTKKSMQIADFEISAWKGEDGLMRMEIRNLKGHDVLHGLNLPWESGALSGRLVFTSNSYIIDSECTGDSDDYRQSPRFLREAGKDPVFRVWFMKGATEEAASPEHKAMLIEVIRREEGRDVETGVLISADVG
jgi:hypothetical protein